MAMSAATANAPELKSVLARIYLFCAMGDLMLIYPFYAVMFSDSGLSTLQISVLFVVWTVVGLLLEVPSGVVADKIDRRVVLVAAEAFKALAFLTWFLEPSFAGFLVGFLLWSANGALYSGTFEALTYDELKAVGQEGLYVKVAARCEGAALTAILLATALAALVPDDTYKVPLLASVCAAVVAGAIALSLPKTARIDDVTDRHYVSILRRGIAAAFKSRVLLSAIALSAFAGSAYGAMEEYSSLFVADIGVSLRGVAIALALVGIATAAASFVAHRLEYIRSSVLYALLAVAGAAMTIAAAMQSVPAIAVLGVYYVLTQMVNVVASARIQHLIDDDTRATTTSVGAFATDIATLGFYALFGIVGDSDRFLAFQVIGAVVVAIALVLGLTSRTRVSELEPRQP